MVRIYQMLTYYRPQRSCRQGNVFTRVCDSVQRGSVCLSACWDTTPPKQTPPKKQTPSEADTPRKQTPPGKQIPPGIRSMSGRYASYWNAFLLLIKIYMQICKTRIICQPQKVTNLLTSHRLLSQGLLGLCCSIETRDRIERITLTAVLFE